MTPDEMRYAWSAVWGIGDAFALFRLWRQYRRLRRQIEMERPRPFVLLALGDLFKRITNVVMGAAISLSAQAAIWVPDETLRPVVVIGLLFFAGIIWTLDQAWATYAERDVERRLATVE